MDFTGHRRFYLAAILFFLAGVAFCVAAFIGNHAMIGLGAAFFGLSTAFGVLGNQRGRKAP